MMARRVAGWMLIGTGSLVFVLGAFLTWSTWGGELDGWQGSDACLSSLAPVWALLLEELLVAAAAAWCRRAFGRPRAARPTPSLDADGPATRQRVSTILPS